MMLKPEHETVLRTVESTLQHARRALKDIDMRSYRLQPEVRQLKEDLNALITAAEVESMTARQGSERERKEQD
jgi:hypothetical protein